MLSAVALAYSMARRRRQRLLLQFTHTQRPPIGFACPPSGVEADMVSGSGTADGMAFSRSKTSSNNVVGSLLLRTTKSAAMTVSLSCPVDDTIRHELVNLSAKFVMLFAGSSSDSPVFRNPNR